MKKTIFALIFPIFFHHCSSTPVPSPQREIRLAFTGDIIMHDAVKLSAFQHNVTGDDRKTSINNMGFDYLFEKISSYLKTSDVVVGNMEFPVSPPFRAENMVFNCIPEIIPSMKQAGFTVMFLANNHILDNGARGIPDTIRYLTGYGMEFMGVHTDEAGARAGLVKNIHGIRVGLIGYVGYANYPIPRVQKGYFINQIYNKERVKQDIAKMRMNCDYLVLIMHSGKEYAIEPLKSDADLIKEYINDGVDLVIRHHPHIVQPAEKVVTRSGREAFIFYSLGNFISNQYFTHRAHNHGGYIVHTKDSIIPVLILKRGETRIHARFEVLPITTMNTIGKKREVQTVSLGDEIQALQDELATADERRMAAIDKELTFLSAKIDVLKKIVYRYGNLKEIVMIERKHGAQEIPGPRGKRSIDSCHERACPIIIMMCREKEKRGF